MASLNDADADAFFQQGDNGTYSGGPGDSIPAGVVNLFDDLEQDALPRLTSEQIERRDRYKRWVTGLVGALGMSAVLAVAIRASGVSVEDAPTASAAVAVPIHAAPEPLAAPAPPVEPAPVEAVLAESAPPAPPPAVVRNEPEKAAEPTQPAGDTARRAKATTDRNTARTPRAPAAAVAPPRATPKALPSLVHSSPPTANFPD